MTLAKGKLYVSLEELNKLFGLPEEVEILSVKGWQGGFEFLLASPEEESASNGTKVTVNSDEGFSNIRRVSLDSLKNTVECVAKITIDKNGIKIGENEFDSIFDITEINGNNKIAIVDRYDMDVIIKQINAESAKNVAKQIVEKLNNATKKSDSNESRSDIERAFEETVNNAMKKKGITGWY